MKIVIAMIGALDEVIPKDQLIQGDHYIGEGRFINGIALWDGKVFHGIQQKFGQYMETTAAYGSSGFDPYCLIERRYN